MYHMFSHFVIDISVPNYFHNESPLNSSVHVINVINRSVSGWFERENHPMHRLDKRVGLFISVSLYSAK